MDDLIRRSDAIEVAYQLRHKPNDKEWEWWLRSFNAIPSVEPNKGDWISVDERLPKACTNVLVTCMWKYSDGMNGKYVCVAQWTPRFCDEALNVSWDEEATEYCEEKDDWYPCEGWYESISNWDDYSLVGISDSVLAWQPLPQPYKEGE